MSVRLYPLPFPLLVFVQRRSFSLQILPLKPDSLKIVDTRPQMCWLNVLASSTSPSLVIISDRRSAGDDHYQWMFIVPLGCEGNGHMRYYNSRCKTPHEAIGPSLTAQGGLDSPSPFGSSLYTCLLQALHDSFAG